MRISVVTVCRNAEKTIGKAIASVAQQSHGDYEHLIVDGASTDGTLKIIQDARHDRMRVISERDRGIYEAMNKGLRRFEGDAVTFLNADDALCGPDVLSAVAAGLDTADIVYGDIKIYNGGKVVRDWISGPFARDNLYKGWVPPHPGFCIRRNVAETTGPFDETIGSAADYDYMLRALANPAWRVRYLPQYLVDFSSGGVSTRSLSNTLKANFVCLRSRQKYLGAGPLDLALFLKVLSKVPQFLSARH